MLASCWLMACTDTESPSLRSVLGELARADASYGFLFDAEPPDGVELKLSLHEPGSNDTCQLYPIDASARKSSAAERGFWYIAVNIKRVGEGEYPVVSAPSERAQASVEVIRVEGQRKAERYRALEGSIQVLDPIEYTTHSSVQVAIRAEFPEHQPEAECEDRGDENGSSASCTCRHDDGRTTHCDAEGQSNCCLPDKGVPTIAFAAELEAVHCPGMCGFAAPDLARYCYADRE